MNRCASVHCERPLARKELVSPAGMLTGLCNRCLNAHRKFTLPVAGFIPSAALTDLSRLIVHHIAPTAAEKAEAVRLSRGPRYPSGPWDERPAYRLAPLHHAGAKRRLPHLLVGKRTPPTVGTIAASFIHMVLAREVMGTGTRYQRYLGGCSFYGRRGVCAPPGRGHEVLLGDRRTTGYRLNVSDYAIIGTHVLRCAALMGLSAKDRNLAAFIVVAYNRGCAEGRYYPPVSHRRLTHPTTQSGDHPLDCRIGVKSGAPREYHDRIRRASGLIDGRWPVGIDPVDEFRPAPSAPPPALRSAPPSALRSAPPPAPPSALRSAPPSTTPSAPQPQTDWIWRS